MVLNSSNRFWSKTPESHNSFKRLSNSSEKWRVNTFFTSNSLFSEPSWANIINRCCCTGLNTVASISILYMIKQRYSFSNYTHRFCLNILIYPRFQPTYRHIIATGCLSLPSLRKGRYRLLMDRLRRDKSKGAYDTSLSDAQSSCAYKEWMNYKSRI